MVRGRKPLPTNLHVLNGNPSHKNLDTNEPKPKPIPPKQPPGMSAGAKKIWKHLEPELDRLGLLTVVDGFAFAAACENYALWQETQRFFRRKDPETGKPYGRTFTTPNGYVGQRPEVAIGQKALSEARAWFTEFGLTPASRVRLGSKPPTGNEENDPMENLLRKRGG